MNALVCSGQWALHKLRALQGPFPPGPSVPGPRHPGGRLEGSRERTLARSHSGVAAGEEIALGSGASQRKTSKEASHERF